MSEIKSQPSARIKRPSLGFVLSLVGGGVSLAFSANLTGYTQTYFVGNLLVENSFVLALIIILMAGMLYERPDRHMVYGATLVVLSANQFVILSSLFMTLPVSALGPIGAGLAFVGGLYGLAFRSTTQPRDAEKI
jgi:hypothetical protein